MLVFRRIQGIPGRYPPSPKDSSTLLYNLNSLPQSYSIIVPLVGAEHVSERRIFCRRGLVALLAVLALSVSLAGRVFPGVVYQSTSVYSGSACERVQHRDADALRWVPPTAVYTLLWTTESAISSEPLGQIHFHPHYDSLYNRPPPVS